MFDTYVVLILFFNRVGIELPTIEVRYENLNIEAEAYMGNRGLPTVINSTMNLIEVLQRTNNIKKIFRVFTFSI